MEGPDTTGSVVKHVVDRALAVGTRQPRRGGPPQVPEKFLLSQLPVQRRGNSRKRRCFPDINARALARAVGVSEGLVGRIMKGERALNLPFAMKVVEVFNGGAGDEARRKGGWTLDYFMEWWVGEVNKLGGREVKYVVHNLFGK